MEPSVAFGIAQRSLEGKPKIPIKQRRTEEVIRAELKFLFELSSRVGREIFPWHSELEIDYKKEFRGIEARRITANSLFMFSDQVYLNAFCHNQQRIRTFRRDRILSARLLDGDELSIPQPGKLNFCDFFVHPKTWGYYRKPSAILIRKMMEKSVPKSERFHLIYKFAARSLERGAWSDFYKDGKAAGVAFLALGTDVKGYDWQAELENMSGGRFNTSAFFEALAAVDHFSSGKAIMRAMDAEPSSA